MGIRIEVRGLEETQRKLEDMKEGLTLEGLQRWAKQIEAQAKALPDARVTQDARDSIHVDVFEVAPRRFDVKLRCKREALPLIAEATKVTLLRMPVTSRAIFKAFLSKVENNISA